MKEKDVTMSEFDYEQLPPALRRKYFSSLERLRLAQDGAGSLWPSRFPPELQRPLTSSNASSSSTRRSSRRPSTILDSGLLTTSSSSRNKLRKYLRRPLVSPQQVAQFAALPPVLRRKYFSREEQVLLASHINTVILDAADEAIYRQFDHPPRPLTAYQDRWTDFPDDLEDLIDDMELSQDELNSLRWLDEEEELDLSLYDYHAAVTETSQHNDDIPSRNFLHRRGLLMPNVSSSRRSSSTTSLRLQPAWPAPAVMASSPSSKTHRSGPATVAGNHRRNRASTSSLEPGATYYQDPTTRMKLRVYLASPQKFDEAVEFGFPSLQNPDTGRPGWSSNHLRSTASTTYHLVNDDTPSLSDGEEQEAETLDSPRTPDVSAFSSTFSKSKESSLDRASIKPKIVRDLTDPYVHALTSSREMTLHMTLTRPDLRSPEAAGSSKDINARPLEQAPLHFSDNTDSFWDSLPDHDSKMKKLFRRLKLRS